MTLQRIEPKHGRKFLKQACLRCHKRLGWGTVWVKRHRECQRLHNREMQKIRESRRSRVVNRGLFPRDTSSSLAKRSKCSTVRISTTTFHVQNPSESKEYLGARQWGIQRAEFVRDMDDISFDICEGSETFSGRDWQALLGLSTRLDV